LTGRNYRLETATRPDGNTNGLADSVDVRMRHGLRSVPLLDLTGTRLGAGSLDFGYGKKG